MNIFIQAYNTNFSQCQYSQNPNQNSSNNIIQATNIAQIAPWPKITLQECSKTNITTYNVPNCNNKMTISHHWNFQWNMKQHFPKLRNQWKSHLDVYMRILSMGLWVLKKPLLIMPIKCWIIFLTMKSKKRGPIGRRSHVDAEKNGFKKWVSPKMGVWQKCSKTQGSKEILREMDEGSLRSLEKCFFFL